MKNFRPTLLFTDLTTLGPKFCEQNPAMNYRMKIPRYQKRPFVHTSLFFCNFRRVCSQFSESLFATLFECLFIEIQEEIRHFAGFGRGDKNLVNKRAFPTIINSANFDQNITRDSLGPAKTYKMSLS